LADNKINQYPANLCLAPFAYLTFDPANNVSPCPALGGSVWRFGDQTIHKIWTNPELTAFRQDMLENKRHDVCSRCWEEESVGMPSQRTRLWDMTLDPAGIATNILETDTTPQAVLEPATYLKGPMQLAIKISNVCNLRCRSCNSNDSVTLAVEGRYYEENYQLRDNVYFQETRAQTFSDQQIEDIVSVCHNVRRLEFYGGEPLLDRQLPRLLQRLIDQEYSRQITINISTNITQPLTTKLVKLLLAFEKVQINLSMDGWAEKFEYLRHPGNWDSVYQNVFAFKRWARASNGRITLLPVITVTTMNVHHLPDLVANMKQHFDLVPFLILCRKPYYFSVRNIPEPIAEEIRDRLTAYTDYNFAAIVRALAEPADPAMWEEFKSWTQMIDQYRKERFSTTFPEYNQLIKRHDATANL
jgi:radical SAM protein with 4Fe4S-binding SPASM domain